MPIVSTLARPQAVIRMGDLDRDSYLSVVDDGGRSIARTVQAAPDAPVPSCPAWRLRDLGYHVGCVMRFWTEAIGAATRPDPIDARLPPPPDSRLERFVLDGVDALLDGLAGAADDTPGWTWWDDPTVRGIPRRLALETAVHRWDAGGTLGDPYAIPSVLAADGVGEFFDVVVLRTQHPWTGAQGAASLEATDVGARWVIDVDAHRHPALTPAGADPAAAHVQVRGTAADILLMLWRRLPPSALHVTGDGRFLGRLLAHPDLD